MVDFAVRTAGRCDIEPYLNFMVLPLVEPRHCVHSKAKSALCINTES
jgi:hypothetical protein